MSNTTDNSSKLNKNQSLRAATGKARMISMRFSTKCTLGFCNRLIDKFDFDVIAEQLVIELDNAYQHAIFVKLGREKQLRETDRKGIEKFLDAKAEWFLSVVQTLCKFPLGVRPELEHELKYFCKKLPDYKIKFKEEETKEAKGYRNEPCAVFVSKLADIYELFSKDKKRANDNFFQECMKEYFYGDFLEFIIEVKDFFDEKSGNDAYRISFPVPKKTQQKEDCFVSNNSRKESLKTESFKSTNTALGYLIRNVLRKREQVLAD